MNENLSRKLYPLLALSLGLVGAGCRFLLYALLQGGGGISCVIGGILLGRWLAS